VDLIFLHWNLVLGEVEGVCCRTAVDMLLVALERELELDVGLVVRIGLKDCCLSIVFSQRS